MCVIWRYAIYFSELDIPFKQFALRWRTEEEVLDGSGETTCGNTRCEHHFPTRFQNKEDKPALTTLELPFTYVEHGESKSALVKVVLCGRCVKKLMWNHNKEKEKRRAEEETTVPQDLPEEEGAKALKNVDEEDSPEKHRQKKRLRESTEEKERSHKRRASRSASPRHRHKDEKRAKRQSSHSRAHET